MDERLQWQQQEELAALYREKWDDELRALAADFDDLTPAAQEALRAEMHSRGLGDPLAPPPPPAPLAPREPQVDGLHTVPGEKNELQGGDVEFTWKTPLCNCETSEQALALVEALRRAGIESWIEGGGRYSWDINGPRILVAADQLEEARKIVAVPIAHEIVDQIRGQLDNPETFELPLCPACGAADPVLDGIDPVNHWLCEACGHEWDDATPPETDSTKN